ncbi:insulin receptor-like isoform X2 [Palaemon carinicauda]|uniref:insulin receptor-like isoform X2 n=1 Tax=Palaemon carinicauda TaxID=392227 RepID=UPI0035B636F9
MGILKAIATRPIGDVTEVRPNGDAKEAPSSRRRFHPYNGTFLLSITSLIILSCSVHVMGDDSSPTICESVEITGFSWNESLAEELSKCRIIQGHLRLQLIEEETEEDIIKFHSFPNLVQVTEYVIIYRVAPLRSLESILPQLSVIRGQELFHGYALVVMGNTYLERLGLDNVTDILNGSVRIEKNWLLCPGLDNRWKNVTTKSSEAKNVIQNNYVYCIYDPCETDNKCPSKAKSNNKFCCTVGGGCYQGPQCHRECAGGCLRANDASACVACRHYMLKNYTCVASCEPSYYISDNKYTCSETPTCFGRQVGTSGCSLCKDNICVKNSCKGTTITSNDLGRSLRGCEYVDGNLIINISGGWNVTQQLEENLKNIRKVTGYIRVSGSKILFSLNFLKNLEVIEGQTKKDNQYVLYVMENEHLQELWETPRKLTIGNNGTFFFLYNPSLCRQLIYDLADASGVARDTMYVSNSTNGQTMPCYDSKMHAEVHNIEDEVGKVSVTWTHKYKGNDRRMVIGFYVYYREAPHNVTLFGNRDACNDESLWDWDLSLPTKSKTQSTILRDLKSYTRYAVYVMAYYTDQEKSGSRSQILYVETLPTSPSKISDVITKHRTPYNLTLEWKTPSEINGNFSHYEIKYNATIRESSQLESVCSSLSSTTTPSSSESVENQSYVESSGKCCGCQDQKQYMYLATIKNNRQFMIAFENYLDKFLYAKVDGKPDYRVPSTLTNHSSPTVGPSATIPPTTEASTQSAIATGRLGRLMTESQSVVDRGTKNDQQNHNQWRGVVTTTNNTITLKKLCHFTEYKVSISACNKDKGGKLLCSIPTLHHTMTMADPEMDRITDFKIWPEEEYLSEDNFAARRKAAGEIAESFRSNAQCHAYNYTYSVPDEVPVVNTSGSSLYGKNLVLSWTPPKNPNGRPQYYIINVADIDGGERNELKPRCISEEEARKNGYTHRLENLYPGDYNISIQLRSEGDSGEMTSLREVIHDPYLVWIIVGPLMGGVIVGVCIMKFLLWNRERRLRADLIGRCVVSTNRQYGELLVCTQGKINEKYVIDPNALEIFFDRKLGKGCFGEVFQGELKQPSGVTRKVAIKDVNRPNAFHEAKGALEEVHHMQDINSHFIVQLVGVMTKMPYIYVVMELMEKGDLRSFLLSEEGMTVTPPKMIEMAIEAADGMAYLAAKKLVHRDLAARNCMLDASLTLKIGDFGLTRQLVKDYYKKIGGDMMPVRWLAPEALEHGRYTSRSDVWSYGVLLWEIYTRGILPFEGNSNETVHKRVIAATLHLEQPPACPDFMYAIMNQCWRRTPKDRPTFIQLIRILLPRTTREYLEYLEKVSFFHKSNCCDSESTEDNDEGFIASGSLDPSLEENYENEDDHSFSSSIPHSLHNVEDDQVCLTPDDHYHSKRMSCGSLSCINSSTKTQGICLTPTRDTFYQLLYHQPSSAQT